MLMPRIIALKIAITNIISIALAVIRDIFGMTFNIINVPINISMIGIITAKGLTRIKGKISYFDIASAKFFISRSFPILA